MEPNDDTVQFQVPTKPALTGLLGRCPRCQPGHLFVTFLKPAPRCDVCDLDFALADPADGPAFLEMSIVAVPALAFALWIRFAFDPPIWVHLLVTLPVTAFACILLLRPLKGWLV
ncbi:MULTISPECIES: DUF983 domain-containing protein [unclassified Rhizobium]|uniref:DUF983 domain-containing protein n=1 Tax=unclassified Rhizobium TaxID=2613769 RepID=UPI000BE84E01|nr:MULTISPECIES: DUF983 domain-containing protein [unclassified Rhizobium]MDF0663669.1 DUF983 domain-containing protein [Rhizobium sp. BC49]PDS80423.1 hypothetical protein CO654_30965 [Rhizobium sp. L18]